MSVEESERSGQPNGSNPNQSHHQEQESAGQETDSTIAGEGVKSNDDSNTETAESSIVVAAVSPPQPSVATKVPGGFGGFTAVNGIKSSISPTSPRRESQQVLPTTNGNAISIETDRSSPPVNAIYPRRSSSSPESIHSPPIRKRSYNEALGDDRDDSITPRKAEAYSEDRKSAEDESRHSGENDEQRLANQALRRESETSRRESNSNYGDERCYLDYERTPAGALIDIDRKKRKRVFSNRTKTGCMTCRKRKKKCDEMHPECNNCLRGGFVCEGYSTRNTWQKPNPSKAPVPLQSKEGPSTYQHTLTQPALAAISTPVRYSDEYINRVDIKPMDDPRRMSPHREQRPPPPPPSSSSYHSSIQPSYSGPPPQLHQQQLPPQSQQQPQLHQQLPQPSGPYGDRVIESRPPLPKSELHDHSESPYPAIQMAPRPPPLIPQPSPSQHHHHQQQQQHQYQSQQQLQQQQQQQVVQQHQQHQQLQQHHQQHQQQQQQQQQHQQQQQQPPPSSHHGPHSSIHSNPQQQQQQPAQMAPPTLTTPPQRPVSHHHPESERDKMLRGEYFLPYTPALIADREQCALAVWRFNNSTNPTMGMKLEERMNFFRDIVNLRPSQDALDGLSNPNDPLIVGSVGSGVIVEAPFSCDYGYNISIGDNVVIGADCRITDTCSVHIGNNVVFSPGVRLMCATYAIDPKERKKGKGRALGRQIVIGDDVWIGSNVIILPGVKIGTCTTIGAGSLLHKDVPPGVVVAGNPPKVVRGIYDDGRP